MKSFQDEYIWIIGASSGIGEALAKTLAARGAILILSARNELALHELNKTLGGQHHVYPLNVADGDQVEKTAETIHSKLGKVDRVIFMAATYRPAGAEKIDKAFAKTLVEINLLGAIYTVYALMPIFEKQQKGQIVLCASVAGFTGLPGGQPYSATKAGVINFAESLYAEVPDYIDVKMINPGFVRTRITDKNQFHMPLRLEPEAAAEAIVKGLKRKAFEIHFPKMFTMAVKLLRLMPYRLALFVTRKLQGKA